MLSHILNLFYSIYDIEEVEDIIKNNFELFGLFENLLNETDQFTEKMVQGLIIPNEREYLTFLYSNQDEKIMDALFYIDTYYDINNQKEILKRWIIYKVLELQKSLKNTSDILQQNKIEIEIRNYCRELKLVNEATSLDTLYDIYLNQNIFAENTIINKQDVLFYILKNFIYYFEAVLKRPYSEVQSNIVKIYAGYDLKDEKNYSKYNLLVINSNRELMDIYPPRIYDKIIDKTIFLNSVSTELTCELKKLHNKGLIQELSFKPQNHGIMHGKYDSNVLLEEVEFGKIFSDDILDSQKLISKLYSDNLENSLWVNIDNSNITFEEMKKDFLWVKDKVITQVFHFEYVKKEDKYYFTHFDHEYILYTLEEYEQRCHDTYQKGHAQKRIKSFKADKCSIPVDYIIQYAVNTLDNNMEIMQENYNINILHFLLGCYFEHKDLLNEYFKKVISKEY